MIGPPPRSTLFPYTPLSRSDVPIGHAEIACEAAKVRRIGAEQHERAEPRRSDRIALGEDRKSTRLNSSHANISYAVFCLKKKTIEHTSTHTSIRNVCQINHH